MRVEFQAGNSTTISYQPAVVWTPASSGTATDVHVTAGVNPIQFRVAVLKADGTVDLAVIPARGYAAFHMDKGQTLRFVDIEGKQVPDLVCFNAHDLGEALNMGNSLLINKRREFIRGNVIYSIRCRPMMTITAS